MQQADKKPPQVIIDLVDNALKDYGMSFAANVKDIPPLPMKRWLSVEEAEFYTSLSRWTLHRAVKDGSLKARKLSEGRTGKIVFEIDEIDRWFDDKYRPDKQYEDRRKKA
jgi:predicted DNA-binding transcriptional regulator AlpA